jgi:hypothetical protein
MKFFSSTQMTWNEPMFFVVRLRERWGWMRRGLLALGIVLLMFLAIFFTRNQPGIGKTIAISVLAGVVLVVLMDVGNIQREVTIKDDCVICSSTVGTFWMTSFALRDIHGVRLLYPQEWTFPYGAMFVQTSDDMFLMGVPNKVSLPTVANVLHRLGVNVQLSGWEPSQADARVQVKDEVVLPKDAAPAYSHARIWPVDPLEGSMSPPLATAIGIVIALGPLILSLLGAIAAGTYLFLKWGALGALTKWLIGGGAAAAFVVSFMYLVVAGQFLAARFMIRVAKSVMATRRDSLFREREEDLIPVEVFDRAAWTSTIVKSVDFGFLRVDLRDRVLKFEGNKNRWDIPATALTTCRIEEAKVGSEASQNVEIRYYVVIAVNHNGEPWEAGMIHTRTELGNDGKEQRYARAQALFQRVSDVVSTA